MSLVRKRIGHCSTCGCTSDEISIYGTVFLHTLFVAQPVQISLLVWNQSFITVYPLLAPVLIHTLTPLFLLSILISSCHPRVCIRNSFKVFDYNFVCYCFACLVVFDLTTLIGYFSLKIQVIKLLINAVFPTLLFFLRLRPSAHVLKHTQTIFLL